MTDIEKITHNFWAQASKAGIYDHTTGLPELLDALIKDNEEDFLAAIERLGYVILDETPVPVQRRG